MAVRASCEGYDPCAAIPGRCLNSHDSSGPRSRLLWRSRSSIAVCLTMVLLVQSFDACCAETLFHRRNHKDQEEHKQEKHTFSVETYTDALEYLIKYGYLNCTSPRTRHYQPLVDTWKLISVEISEDSNHLARNICKKLEVQRALRFLQSNLNLNPTGCLNDLTRRAMNKRRCGNTDIDKTQTTSLSLDLVHKRNGVGTEHADGLQHRWIGEVLGSSRKRSRSRRSVKLTAVLVLPKLDGRTRSGQSDLEPVESAETNAIERRKRMLQAIRDRLIGQSVELDGLPLAERLLAKRISGFKVMRRSRRKRLSIQAGFTERVKDKETSTEGRQKLVKDEDKPVRWRLLADGISEQIPLIDQKAVLELSFRMWNEVIPLKFAEDNERDISNIDIVVGFGRGTHWNCEKPFDGAGGELAHSWGSGDVHFDDDENYRKDGTGIDLLKLAVHEIGHVLGLLHNDRRHSIMYPIYISPSSDEDFELVREDREAVQQIYGICKGTFDVVFDWVRKVLDRDTHQPKYIYNTYFFRNNRYWMYENSHNRTRYGDPRYIEAEWNRLPSNLDGCAQVVSNTGTDFSINTYFFKGDMYYRYDDNRDRVMDGYPRRIAEDFGPRPGFNESVPNSIDAVVFDSTIGKRDTLYFFKGEWVWLYDAREIGRNTCCDSKRRFTELFPMVDSDPTDALTGNIDSVYYSYRFHTMYFFSKELVYSLVSNHNGSASSKVGLRKLTQWYHIWRDICDVD